MNDKVNNPITNQENYNNLDFLNSKSSIIYNSNPTHMSPTKVAKSVYYDENINKFSMSHFEMLLDLYNYNEDIIEINSTTKLNKFKLFMNTHPYINTYYRTKYNTYNDGMKKQCSTILAVYISACSLMLFYGIKNKNTKMMYSTLLLFFPYIAYIKNRKNMFNRFANFELKEELFKKYYEHDYNKFKNSISNLK